MKRLTQRVEQLEAGSREPQKDSEASIDELCRNHGTTRAEVERAFGSIGAWAYKRMVDGASRPSTGPGAPEDATARHARMIGK